MQDITRDLFVSIAVIGGIFGIAYLFFTTRHRERMSMLERGLDPSTMMTKPRAGSYTLKFGMLAVGIALGILSGNFLEGYLDMNKAPAILSMIFLFGGLSLIMNYVVDRGKGI